MPPKPKKKKPGPAPKNPEDRAQIVSTSVPAPLKAWLVKQGGGKLTAGMRSVLTEAYENYLARNSLNS